MGKAVLFIGGKVPQKNQYIDEMRDCDVIIAADSGLYTVQRDGLRADVFIGDGDSFNGKYESIPSIHLYPRDKDETDAQLAFQYAFEKGFTSNHIILIGGGGGRLDHLLSLFSRYYTPLYPKRWYTANECIHYVDKKLFIEGLTQGKKIGVSGTREQTSFVTASGLKWPLNRFPVSVCKHSISNENTGDVIEVEVENGPAVLVMISYTNEEDIRGADYQAEYTPVK